MSFLTFLRDKLAFMGGQNFVKGAIAGAAHEMASRFTNDEVTIADGLAKALRHCEPWTDHLLPSTLEQMTKAIHKKDLYSARAIVTSGALPDSNVLCIELLKIAIVHIGTKAPTVLLEAIPISYYY